MGRNARLKKERRKARESGLVTKTIMEGPISADGQQITLNNPQKKNFGAFVVGNHAFWEKQVVREIMEQAPEELHLISPQDGVALTTGEFLTRLHEIIERRGLESYVVQKDEAKGRELVICGAGPSLRETAHQWCTPERDIWGCNSALTWLFDNGIKPTHGFSVDQTPELLAEWAEAPDVEYLLASTVHVHMAEHLAMNGRKIRWFHNYVGLEGADVTYEGESMPFEDWLYCLTFMPTIRCGSGLNTVNRAMDLAMFMGYDKIRVLGMDCAMVMKEPPPDPVLHPAGSPGFIEWLDKSTVMHANGDSSVHNGLSPVTLDATIDGQTFLTKPDMIISAVWATMFERINADRVEIIGSPLLDVLRTKPIEYLKRLPTLTNNGKMVFPRFGKEDAEDVEEATV